MSLLENANSFLVESLSKAIVADEHYIQWKFAILSLIQAIELAIKERLRREHPVLIFTNIDNQKNTVSLETALQRLPNVSKVDLSERDIKAINTAREWRNLITHHEFKFSVETIKSVYAILFGFCAEFNRKHLDQDLGKILPQELWRCALSVSAYFEELKHRAGIRIKEENDINQWVCPCNQCGASTFVLQPNLANIIAYYGLCYVCGHNEELSGCDRCLGLFYFDDLKMAYIERPQGESSWVQVCSDCHTALIQIDR